MPNMVSIGLATEGTTDNRFLENVVQRTFEEVAFDCQGEIDVWNIVNIPMNKEDFVQDVLDVSEKAFMQGINVLCIHADADNRNDTLTFRNKINPAFDANNQCSKSLCKNLVPVVPIQMTEAWILADKDLLKCELSTNLSDSVLGLSRKPESIADPKETIERIITIISKSMTRGRKKLEISEIYLPIGQKIELTRLENLESYRKFKGAVRNAYRKLGYLY